ncbi:hypothetical protein [Micromonospora rifamycinica]|uniref:Uncharacterized protein n=1 Tax=Micromonospora rifamycinica TaxID=291594 RepID=A0A109IPC3_9ACTN|nr:hypothetical protein [Micromonospora rifamycinica]KWV34238.1 hypothetical protein AWV63_03035 [Micromonospora rifamycinica]SCG81037.1 hypothetical protein GA0070623_5410 [Micromonospora rifamycinica]
MRAGDAFDVTRSASVQFLRPIRFRLIRVLDWPTYDGWVWLDGYQLNAKGDAVSRRKIFVQKDGLRPAALTRPTCRKTTRV